jgi:hypothetical protein
MKSDFYPSKNKHKFATIFDIIFFIAEEKITEISFFGGIGGILGLFLGFSFISAVEIIILLVNLSKRIIMDTKLSEG